VRGPLQDSFGEHYERPNQAWVCGLAGDGETHDQPCPMGPTAGGQCPATAACHPRQDGERWFCNRSPLRGGECEAGPTPDGACCQVLVCQPVRSLRATRGRFVVGCTLATLGALAMILSTGWRNEFIAPGPLSVHHAQLLARGPGRTERCASCHAAGDQSFLDWLAHATHADLGHPTQSTLCMECHKQQISPDAALWAHNIDPEILLASTANEVRVPAKARRLNPTKPLACAACHREHQGANHDITFLSDTSCQACHQEEYHSFATDHPEFTAWPTRRRTQIAFDHGLHEAKHFPEQKQAFECATCHQQDSTGGFQLTLGYEETCASCHDPGMNTSWDANLPFVSLPMLDTEALDDAGHSVGQWPEEATGDFDGPLPLPLKLLLLVDERAASAMEKLGVDFDFFDVDANDEQQVAAAAEVVWATKRLLHELAHRGQEAIRQRVAKLLDREISNAELAALTAHLSPDTLSVITERWLTELSETELPEEVSDTTSQDSKPAAESSEALPPDREAGSNSFARERVAAGGWLRDELTFSIRYRPTGHADLWMKAWIELAAEATGNQHRAAAEKLLQQAMKPTAPGLCGSCHSIDRTESGALAVHWFAKQPADAGPQFTFFSHRPHLSQAELTDCQSCHRISESTGVMESYTQFDPQQFTADFHALTKQSCAECHTPKGAGDSCTQCHKYHVGSGD